ncbi:pyridoxamine 5'-phosphate oxidase family protein [Actinacidiphila guanduensis]|uniref:PPOX class probable F420-dependent enzyme n=1 Tax=Actinacidiphila guanduensis TaxID=310781 RepID=A0A1H0H0Q3_9ACTN|nr:TIGR03618 family F420-dependent PPOX class oxidoreductase [Actinacidiphila guanduensis]SDO12728.1 PPOX class probable F420-dependent enzyme [Actinacidiphila guanduensis]
MSDGRRPERDTALRSPRLPAGAAEFLAGPHIGTLTTVRSDGSPHIAPVRFTWDGQAGLVRVMTTGTRVKTRNIAARPDVRIAICQTVNYRWITLEGLATVSADRARVSEGVRRYIQRYLSAPPNVPDMVVIELAVDRVMGIW